MNEMSVYANMKESGIDWIGAVPSHWAMHTLYQLVSPVKAKNKDLSEKNLLSLSYGKIKRKNIEDTEGLLPESFDGYNIIEAGDVVLRLTDLQNDHTSLRVGLATERGIITSAYTTLRPSENCVSKYLYYLLHSFDIRKGFYGMGSGVRQGLNYDEVKELRIVLPRYDEQEAIGAYLDEQCALIDEAIIEARTSIDEYKTWRKAVITHAVTRGLNHDTDTYDTGIPWVGQIPNGWAFVKITNILDSNHAYPIGDGDHGLIKATDYVDAGIPYIRVQNLGWGTDLCLDGIMYITSEMNEKIKSSILKPNDVLFAKTGGTIGKTGIVPQNMPVANTTSHVGKITVSPKHNPRYVFYVLSSNIGYNQFWEIASAKTTRPELSIDEIKSLRITLPSNRVEQDEIVSYLDRVCPIIDSMIGVKESLVIELEQYKQSLIFETVTGKRKVVQ